MKLVDKLKDVGSFLGDYFLGTGMRKKFSRYRNTYLENYEEERKLLRGHMIFHTLMGRVLPNSIELGGIIGYMVTKEPAFLAGGIIMGEGLRWLGFHYEGESFDSAQESLRHHML